MRYVLALLALVLLAGCAAPTAEPRLIVKSPLWLDTQPILQPSGFAMPVQAAPQFVAVPQAPVAGACQVPQAGYTPGYTWAPPPVAAPAAGCR